MCKRTACVVGLLIAIVFALAGCLVEGITWSPDGRYVVFTDSVLTAEGGKLWRWDSRTGRTEEKELRSGGGDFHPGGTIQGNVTACRYLPSGDKIVVATCGEKGHSALHFVNAEGGGCREVARAMSPHFDVSKDGKRIYFLVEQELEQADGKKKRNVAIYKYEEGMEPCPIVTDLEDADFPRADTTGSRFLFSAGKSLILFDIGSGQRHELVAVEEAVHWPCWVNDDTVIYLVMREDSSDSLLGDLCILSFSDGAPRVLASNVCARWAPVLHPKGGSVVVTKLRPGAPGEIDDNGPGSHQAASVDLVTGETTWLTDAPFGAVSAAYSPDSRRLAYFTAMGILEVLDLATGHRRLAWRNEQEHLYAIADSLEQGGDVFEAANTWRELIARFPDWDDRKVAYYRLALLYLDSRIADLDKAFSAWREINEQDLEPQIESRFWREQDRVTTDPAEDWIQTYGTPASKKELKFDSDSVRDLRNLWVRSSKEWLFVRIDYGSDRDLTGLRLQDTLLLFDQNEGHGTKRITETTEWDGTADAQVLMRHWQPAGDDSQYDMEVRDSKGRVVRRYLASGFEPPACPVFEVRRFDAGESHAVMYAMSRKALGMSRDCEVHLQVCTLKGGIESLQGKERPRIQARDGRTVCDVADTFGAENTRERIEADLEKAGDPGAKALIKGAAARFVMKGE